MAGPAAVALAWARPGALAAGWVLGYAAVQVIVRDRPDGALYQANIAYLVPIVVAVVLCLRAARTTTRAWRRFWVLIGMSTALWLAGEMSWAWYAVVLREEVPFPALPDVFYVASYLPALVAFALAFGGAGPLRQYRALLDASVVALVVGAVGWQLLVAPQLETGLSIATLAAAAPPLLDIALLVLIGTLGFSGHRNVPGAVTAVVLAYVCFALGDVIYTYLVLLETDGYPALLDLCWQAAGVLVALGAVMGRRSRNQPVPERSVRDRGLPMVLAGTIATFGAVLVDARDDRLETWVLGLLAYVVVAVIIRLLLTSRDKDRVTGDLELALAEQERLAVTDGLTGLYNRRFVEEMLRLETERALRSGERLGLLVLDVDHFKSVNDTHGHPAGDDVLKAIAERLAGAVRRPDVVGRYGGEEFVVILPGASGAVLLELAERCRRTVADHPFPLRDGPPVRATVSIGVAGVPEHAITAGELVRVADRALYLAKAAGRNTTQVGADAAVPAGPPESALHERQEQLGLAGDARRRAR